MKLAFDLISDLHVETWGQPFDWTGQPTSMICVVAGDISRDRDLVVKTLKHLSEVYRVVLFIDGNDEHRFTLGDLGDSYRSLVEEISSIKNVVYLQDNVCIIDGVAFIGTNGWWTYDLDPNVDYDQTKLWFQDRYQVDRNIADAIEAMALQDYAYLAKSVEKLQTHLEVKKIVVVTHTVPALELIDHDIGLNESYRINSSGNSHIVKAIRNDTEGKIHTWCFGHYHGDVDSVNHQIRFVNNCRGRGGTPWCKEIYYPKRIVIDL